MSKVKELFLSNLRLLFLKATSEELEKYDRSHLLFGIVCTWIVGMGRWWDDPGANILQHLGVGSVAYIFILSVLIWLLVLPLKPRRWAYRQVLTFVSFTSIPAVLYAVPVERFVTIDTAILINMWFLGVVAVWRILLFFFYLRRYAGLNWFYQLVVVLFPLSVIVTTLFALNLHRVIFDIMGGLREREKSSFDGEYGLLFLMTYFSIFAFIPLLLSYLGILFHARKIRK